MRLILASTSPRRREILALLGLPFDIIAPPFEERVTPHLSIEDEVLDFAFGKAESVARNYPDALVIGSDTMISLAGEKMGKPRDRDDARRMLGALSGKTHEIFTAVALLDRAGGRELRIVERVLVDMRQFIEREIDNYLDCNESLDKAGAYSIQGRGETLIDSIRGDYLAAVGMPLRPIANYLASRGILFGDSVDRVYAEKSFLNWQRFS
ncbi:MAG: maf [Deltaproteobacteria bacterium]|nr:maf [Deltaproteobacteria bacterium]